VARLAFAELHGETVSLTGLDGKAYEGSPEQIDVLLLSRLDCEVRCLELPPVAERELPALIRYRIRSVYPGSLEPVLIDQVVQRRRSGQVAMVAIADRQAVEQFRRAAPKAVLSLLSAALLRSAAFRREGVCEGAVVCESPRYAEVLRFQDGVLVESVLVKRSRPSSDAQKILHLLGDGAMRSALVLAPREELEEAAGRLRGQGDAELAARAIESMDFTRRGTPSLFRPRRQLRLPRPVLTRAALGLAIALCSVGIVWKQAHLRQVELSRLRTAVLGSQVSGQRAADLAAEYAAVKTRVSVLAASRPVDALQFFSDLRDELGPGVSVQDLVLQNGSFQLQAVGPSPLALMQRFIADPRFQAVRLLQTTPLAGGASQQFIITGRYGR